MNLFSDSNDQLFNARLTAPKRNLIQAILEIRAEDLCNPKQEIGTKIWSGSDKLGELAKLLEPFGWSIPKAKAKSCYLVKERMFATKDDPQPDPPTPPETPAPKRKRKRPEQAAA
jgi:hypothetical protein